MKFKPIDLRSDTVTQPTEEMRDAMRGAPVGDDVFHEDPTVNQLEDLAARMLGKEGALFVVSGTQGNLVSLLSQTERGDEIIVEELSHIFKYEVGGYAVIGGLTAKPIPSEKGVLNPEVIERAIRPQDIHQPITRMVCVENTHNMHGGTITPPQRMNEICDLAHQYGLKVHLDGARVFNASVALGIDVKKLTRPADSVMACLSKGLCAPVGSIVAGNEGFIGSARRYRKMLGGGMRQAGIIAAAGIVALEKMVTRLAEDHATARLIAERLNHVPGLSIDMDRVQTNIVFVDFSKLHTTGKELERLLEKRGVLVIALGDTQFRVVTHYGIEKDDAERASEIIEEVRMEIIRKKGLRSERRG